MTEKEQILDLLKQLLAVEKLEYLDKNLLAFSPKTRSEWRQKTLLEIIELVKGDD